MLAGIYIDIIILSEIIPSEKVNFEFYNICKFVYCFFN